MQSQELKNGFLNEGMKVYRDAMIEMESKTPQPVILPLTKGKMYQIIFVGSKQAIDITFEVFSGKDQKLDQKVLNLPSQTNYIIYPFIPEQTDEYMFVITQNQKNRTMCGSISILEPGGDTKDEASQPAKPISNQQPTRYKRGSNIK